MKDLAAYGPWALVTGASSGIGEHFARLLAEHGLNLLVTARRGDRLRKLAGELSAAHGIEVEVIELDASSPHFVSSLTSAIGERDVGLLVSNAGFGLKGRHHEQDAAELDAMLAVNGRAPMLLCHALAPRLRARGRGGIILTASMEGFVPFPYSAAYAASKAFVLSLGESLAWELKPDGVDVLVLCPGSTDTEALPLQGFEPGALKGLMSPGQVAAQALQALGNKSVLVTGGMNRGFVKLLSNLPRGLAVKLTGSAMRSATGGDK